MAIVNVYQTTPNGDVIPKEITGKVERIERAGHTIYGNPIIRIYVNGVSVDGRDCSGIYRISDNASMVYEISNPEFKNENHTFALTRAGRISHIVRRAEHTSDNRPHSRACGIQRHDHGAMCSPNCPTCHGGRH